MGVQDGSGEAYQDGLKQPNAPTSPVVSNSQSPAAQAYKKSRSPRFYKRLSYWLGLQAVVAVGAMAYAGMFNIKLMSQHHPADGCEERHAIPFVRVHEYVGLSPWLFHDGKGHETFTEYWTAPDGHPINVYESGSHRGDEKLRDGRYWFRGSPDWAERVNSYEARSAERLIRQSLNCFTKTDAEAASASYSRSRAASGGVTISGTATGEETFILSDGVKLDLGGLLDGDD